jgi:hypothetical protein
MKSELEIIMFQTSRQELDQKLNKTEQGRGIVRF